jgi:hypothetical protein
VRATVNGASGDCERIRLEVRGGEQFQNGKNRVHSPVFCEE